MWLGRRRGAQRPGIGFPAGKWLLLGNRIVALGFGVPTWRPSAPSRLGGRRDGYTNGGSYLTRSSHPRRFGLLRGESLVPAGRAGPFRDLAGHFVVPRRLRTFGIVSYRTGCYDGRRFIGQRLPGR